MTDGKPHVHAVHIAPEAGATMKSVDEVEAVANQGLRGDRYFKDSGTWSDDDKGRDIRRDITLFEVEALEIVARDYDIHLDPSDHRRNITTQNVAVDHLLDERFRIGRVLCEGIEICEPCTYLESHTQKGVLKAFMHRAGLNAAVLKSGMINVGDQIEVV